MTIVLEWLTDLILISLKSSKNMMSKSFVANRERTNVSNLEKSDLRMIWGGDAKVN